MAGADTHEVLEVVEGPGSGKQGVQREDGDAGDAKAASGNMDDKDCWHYVSDARKRKQIQDRLAQRARSE
jgi:hypothetical protein